MSQGGEYTRGMLSTGVLGSKAQPEGTGRVSKGENAQLQGNLQPSYIFVKILALQQKKNFFEQHEKYFKKNQEKV